jgi:hypothetical protein
MHKNQWPMVWHEMCYVSIVSGTGHGLHIS